MNQRVMVVLSGAWARGAETSTLYLLNGLAGLGYKNIRVHVLAKTSPDEEESKRELYLLPRFSEVAETTWERETEDVLLNLQAAIESFRPNILLYPFLNYIPVASFRADPNIKNILVVHGIAVNDFNAYHQEFTHQVVCVSRRAARRAIELGIPRYKVVSIWNGVPQMAGRSRRSDWGIPESAWVWCFVGGLTNLKRPELLLESVARRGQTDEYVILAGIADPSLKTEEYAAKLGIAERCHFAGHVSDIENVYCSSDALVITSLRESLPLTMLEAMSSGIGVVANDVGGISEVLRDTEHGVLCRAENTEELDSALDRMREMDRDAVHRSALYHWEARFSVEAMANQYDALFARLMFTI